MFTTFPIDTGRAAVLAFSFSFLYRDNNNNEIPPERKNLSNTKPAISPLFRAKETRENMFTKKERTPRGADTRKTYIKRYKPCEIGLL